MSDKMIEGTPFSESLSMGELRERMERGLAEIHQRIETENFTDEQWRKMCELMEKVVEITEEVASEKGLPPLEHAEGKGSLRQ